MHFKKFRLCFHQKLAKLDDGTQCIVCWSELTDCC